MINITSNFTEEGAKTSIQNNFDNSFNEIKNISNLQKNAKSLLKNINNTLAEIDNSCKNKLLDNTSYKNIAQQVMDCIQVIKEDTEFQTNNNNIDAIILSRQINNSDKLQLYLKQIFINDSIESAIKIYTTNEN